MATIHRHALPSGYEFEGFHIEAVLGAGGFGITYKARAIGEARAVGGHERVAIKEYLPSGIATREPDGFSVQPVSTDDTEDYGFGLDRFRAEAAVLGRFAHPNLVRTRAFFEANGTAYLIMNFVDGESLYDLLKPDKTLSGDELGEMIGPLLDGLAAVHAGRFLHRDIKPGNIVIQRDGAPVLIDFGAAREALGEKSQSLTSIFTPGYAPPEQYHRRGNQGPWTDIYALGATFYRCVTSERPPPAVERVMKDDYVSVGARAKAEHAPALLRAVDAALRVDEADRPQDVADWRRMIAGEIEEVSQLTRPMVGPQPPKLPPARPRKRPGARPPLSDAAPARAGGGSWRRWGTTLASFAAIVIVGTTGYYGYEQYRGQGGEAEPAAVGQAAKPGGTGRAAKRAEETPRPRVEAERRRAEEERRRSAEESRRAAEERRRAEAEVRRRQKAPRRRSAQPVPRPAPRAAASAAGCPIAVVALRRYLVATDCKQIGAVLNAAVTARTGQLVRWRNALNDHAGTVTFVARSKDGDGRACWQLRQTFAGSGVTASGTGLACKVGAVWRIVR